MQPQHGRVLTLCVKPADHQVQGAVVFPLSYSPTGIDAYVDFFTVKHQVGITSTRLYVWREVLCLTLRSDQELRP